MEPTTTKTNNTPAPHAPAPHLRLARLELHDAPPRVPPRRLDRPLHHPVQLGDRVGRRPRVEVDHLRLDARRALSVGRQGLELLGEFLGDRPPVLVAQQPLGELQGGGALVLGADLEGGGALGGGDVGELALGALAAGEVGLDAAWVWVVCFVLFCLKGCVVLFEGCVVFVLLLERRR